MYRRRRNLVLAASVLVCAIILAALFYRNFGELRGGAAVVAQSITMQVSSAGTPKTMLVSWPNFRQE